MKRILITGVAGFIGSHIARRFLESDYRVIGVDDLSGGQIENVPKEIEFIQGDLSDISLVQRLPKNCEKILHLAGQSSGEISFDDPVADLQKNTISTLNLIRYGLENSSERIVYASSMSVYGDVPAIPIEENHPLAPLSCYGVGKLAAENYLRVYQAKLPYVSLRMFNVYGPGQNLRNLRQGMVSIYLAQALKGGNIEVKGSLERYRDFIYIDDVVETWFRATFNKSVLNKELNVGTGIKTTVDSLLSLIETKIPGSSHFVSNPTPGDQSGIFAEIAQLRELLGREKFISLDEGLDRFIESIN